MAGTNLYTSTINPNVLIALTDEDGYAQYSKLINTTTLPTDTGMFAQGGELIVPATGGIYINRAADGLAPDWFAVGGTLEAVVEISSAQILSLFTTPVQLIPAPGVGKCIVVERAVMKYTHGSASYTQPGNTNISINAVNTVQFGNILNSATTLIQITPAQTYRGAENTPLLLVNTIGNPTVGDGTVLIYVYYDIKTF